MEMLLNVSEASPVSCGNFNLILRLADKLWIDDDNQLGHV